jgi:hypothetical protein
MKIKNHYTLEAGVHGACKSPAIWATNKYGKKIPLMFLKKPKWMSETDFNYLVNSINLDIPSDYEFDD